MSLCTTAVTDEVGRKPESSPAGAPLADTAGVWVAALGQLCGPTGLHRLIAEGAAEAWGTCAPLAHAATARAVVTNAVDTAAVWRGQIGQGRLGARMQLKGITGNGAASADLTSESQNLRSSQTHVRLKDTRGGRCHF